MRIETAIVPIAGLGTRLLPISAGVPKEMLPLGRKPTLHYIAEELGRVGIRRIIFVSSLAKQHIVHYFQLNQSLEDTLRKQGKHDLLESLWSHSPYMGIDFDIVIQHQPKGLGDAVLCGQPDSPQPVVVALADCVMGINGKSDVLERMIAVFESKSAEIVIACEEVAPDKVDQFGIATPKAGQSNSPVFELGDLVEKPALHEAASNLAIAGRYVLSHEIFTELKYTRPNKNGEIQLTDAIRKLILAGARAYGVRLAPGERRYDVGNIDSYTEAFVDFALADPGLSEIVLRSIPAQSKPRLT
jgi:UTP--glucose-1-phosphate uridylyltransferase